MMTVFSSIIGALLGLGGDAPMYRDVFKNTAHSKYSFIDETEQESTKSSTSKSQSAEQKKPLKSSFSTLKDASLSAPTKPEEAAVPERNLVLYWSKLSDSDLQKDVVELQRANKYNAAQDRLDFMIQRNPSLYNRYLWAKNNELLEHYDLALQEYTALLESTDMEAAWHVDLRYRRGIVLDDLGRHREAISDFKKARRSKHISTLDKQMINLLIGTARINRGWSFCGIRGINRALPFFESGTKAVWARARARNALVHELITKAESRAIRPGEKMNDDILFRQQWLYEAEAQAAGIIQLGEPEYVQKAFIVLIDAYMRFYDDVVYLAPPEEFDAFQRVIYKAKMREKADVLKYRAQRLSKKALNYADSITWQGMDRNALYHRQMAIDRND